MIKHINGIIYIIGENKKEEKMTDYYETQKAWESISPVMGWDDIKENTVYHVPPFNKEERKDILVVEKSKYSISYKKIMEDGKINNVLFTIYPSSMMTHFLVPHLIKEIKVE